MDFLDKRVGVICNELKKLKVKQVFPLTQWEYKEGNFIHPEDALKDEAAWENFDCKTMHWYGKDRHYWFRTTYTVPEELDGKSIWIRVSSQIDEWDDGRNPQFIVFVNGEVYQGIDMNHRECLITRSGKAGETLTIDLQAYTGIMHEEFALRTQIEEIDAEIEKLYYDLWVPLAAFSRMEADDKNRKDIEYVLNETINLLDLRTPYSEGFYRSVREASAYIQKALYEDMAGYEDVIATCIGHTHIDVAWWWTVAQTREKVGRSFATVLKLMDEYPNYKFMSSQPQLYAFLKERYPELYEKAKQRIKEKRWEPEGGMWVEADCNLTSGESLVRQFMHGKRFFKEEFGVDNRILWLPDVFGYSGALPQIMKKCGIDYFMTTKLAWNQFNKVPYDTMMWRGIDGTEVLTHLITTLGVSQPIKDYFTTYNGMLHPDAIMGGWMRYQNKDINNDILVSYGYGDGGGGPTREMLETSIRMEKGIKGIPKVRQEFSRTYFEELEERVKGDRRLPVWEGEFYFEYHRGTYTSMARNKRSNRKAELGLMDLELLSVLAQAQVAYPAEELLPGYGPDAEDAEVNVPGKAGNPDNYDYPDRESAVFVFDENGVFQKDQCGVYNDNGITRWINNGMLIWHAGLVKDGDNFRYFKRNGMVANVETYVAKTNGLLKAAKYTFDAEGKLMKLEGLHEDLNGNLCYYVDYVKSYAGLVKDDDGNFYYIASDLKAVKNCTYYVTKTNDLKPVGYYAFDADGKMIVKNGLVEENGDLYYYVDGAKTAAGMIEWEGNYYYIASDLKAVKDAKHYIFADRANGFVSAGWYWFNADGTMFLNGIREENGTKYYYKDGVKNYAGLVKIDGDYYYVRSDCTVVCGRSYYVTKTNGLMPNATYIFDEDGKMVIKNGIYREKLGNGNEYLFYYVNNVRQVNTGLVQLDDGSYIYVRSGANLAVGDYYVTKTNGLLPKGIYSFGDDGKMIKNP